MSHLTPRLPMDLKFDKRLPRGIWGAGRHGLLAFGATLVGALDDQSARREIRAAMARFELNPNQAMDVIAASAFVWSTHALPRLKPTPLSGPALDEAAQAIMRLTLISPAVFLNVGRDAASTSRILLAASGGLAEYAFESQTSHCRSWGFYFVATRPARLSGALGQAKLIPQRIRRRWRDWAAAKPQGSWEHLFAAFLHGAQGAET